MLLLDAVGGVVHGLDFPPALTQALDFLEAARTLVDLAVLSEDFGLLHHVFNIFLDGHNAVQDVLGSVPREGAFRIDHRLVLLDLLLHIHQPLFYPV